MIWRCYKPKLRMIRLPLFDFDRAWVNRLLAMVFPKRVSCPQAATLRSVVLRP